MSTEHMTPVDLKGAIVPLDMVPLVEWSDELHVTPGTVVSNVEIEVGGTVLNIKTQLLAFNALLLHRDQMMGSAALRDAVGFANNRTTFEHHLKALSARLGQAAGQQLLETKGRSSQMQYRLSPSFQLIDKRVGSEASLPEKLQNLTIDYPTDFNEFDGTKLVNFKDDKARMRGFSMIIKHYVKDKRIRGALAAVFGENWATIQTRFLDPGQRLSDEACREYFFEIERGLAAAVHPQQSPEAFAAISSMICAYQTLYYRHLYLVEYIARSFGLPRDREELFDIGCAELVATVMTYTAKRKAGQSEGSFSSAAYAAVQNRIKHYLTYESSIIRLPKHIIDRQRTISRAAETLTQIYRRYPTRREVAAHLGLKEQQVDEALINSSSQRIDWDMASPGYDFDRELERYVIEVQIHALFQDPALSDREKIVLSLLYGIFSTSLSGAEFHAKGQNPFVFVYPYSREQLPWKQVPTKADLAKAFGLDPTAIRHVEKRALAKCRGILLDKARLGSLITIALEGDEQ